MKKQKFLDVNALDVNVIIIWVAISNSTHTNSKGSETQQILISIDFNLAKL